MGNEPHADFRLFLLANQWVQEWFLTCIEKKPGTSRRAIADVERYGRLSEYDVWLLAGFCGLYPEKNEAEYILHRTRPEGLAYIGPTPAMAG